MTDPFDVAARLGVPVAEADALIVLLHGRSVSGNSLVLPAQALLEEVAEVSPKKIAVVLLQGDAQSSAGRALVWWKAPQHSFTEDLEANAFYATPPPDSVVRFALSVQKLLEDCPRPPVLILGGFSQGAQLALHGIGELRKRGVAAYALLMMSGFLDAPLIQWASNLMLQDVNDPLRVFASHGQLDPSLPQDMMTASVAAVKGLRNMINFRLALETVTHDGQHEVGTNTLEAAAWWLRDAMTGPAALHVEYVEDAEAEPDKQETNIIKDLERKVFDGLWKAVNADNVHAIKGNRLTWANREVSTIEFTSERSFLVTVEGQDYYGRLSEDTEMLIWSDGDIWTRETHRKLIAKRVAIAKSKMKALPPKAWKLTKDPPHPPVRTAPLTHPPNRSRAFTKEAEKVPIKSKRNTKLAAPRNQRVLKEISLAELRENFASQEEDTEMAPSQKPAPTVSAESVEYKPGSEVRLHRLERAAHLNGTRGKLLSFNDEMKIWEVQVSVTKERVFAHPSNLQPFISEEEHRRKALLARRQVPTKKQVEELRAASIDTIFDVPQVHKLIWGCSVEDGAAAVEVELAMVPDDAEVLEIGEVPCLVFGPPDITAKAPTTMIFHGCCEDVAASLGPLARAYASSTAGRAVVPIGTPKASQWLPWARGLVAGVVPELGFGPLIVHGIYTGSVPAVQVAAERSQQNAGNPECQLLVLENGVASASMIPGLIGIVGHESDPLGCAGDVAKLRLVCCPVALVRGTPKRMLFEEADHLSLLEGLCGALPTVIRQDSALNAHGDGLQPELAGIVMEAIQSVMGLKP